MSIAKLPLVLSAFLLVSCVSKTKYDQLLTSKARVDRENARLGKVEDDYLALIEEMSRARQQLSRKEEAMTQLQDKYNNLEGAHAALQQEYDKLLQDNNALLSAASQEKEELTALLTEKQIQLDEKERALRRLENELAEREAELAVREERIETLNAQLQRQQQSLAELRSSISDALLGISDADLTVEQKNGKIYVSLSQNLLFEKNSNRVDRAGKEALARLAEVLQDTDVNITVEGHTDSDGEAAYNWNLSVTRATAVVNELTSNGLSGERITAAGRAFYQPVDTNETLEGKAKNRRTEIILTPRLDRLMELIEE